MHPVVSVVVPIYKVELYLRRCVDSILNQTYTHLEIILVNDGSPDQCGDIADSYALKDNRVRVIHKHNGGLSDARNAGMQVVTGDYTMFVDSDDWLEKTMIEELVDKSIHYKAEVVQSAFYYAYDDYLQLDTRYFSDKDDPVVLNNKQLMYELVINEKIKNFAWGKLYQTSLIKDIPFRKGVLFEDVFWAHHVMHRVNTYVIIHLPLLYYYQRNDSIVASYSPKNLDMIRGLKERHLFIEMYYSELTSESYKSLLKANLTHYTLLLANRKNGSNRFYRKKIQKYIKRYFNHFNRSVQADRHLKNQLLLFYVHPYFNIAYLLARRLSIKMRILPLPNGLKRLDL